MSKRIKQGTSKGLFSELGSGKAMVAYTKPRQRKKEEEAKRRERSGQVY